MLNRNHVPEKKELHVVGQVPGVTEARVVQAAQVIDVQKVAPPGYENIVLDNLSINWSDPLTFNHFTFPGSSTL